MRISCLCAGAVLLLSSPLVAEDTIPVETTIALRSEETTKLSLTGTVSSQRQARLSTRTEGLVEEVKVEAGHRVEKGDTLLILDARLAEIELDLVLAEMEAAKLQQEEATRRFNEVKELIDTGAIAKTEAETLANNVAIRDAELGVLEVREKQARERIDRHRLVAPFDGIIGKKETEAGEWLENGTTVFELVETESLWFDLQVAQEFLPLVLNADRAELTLDAFPGKTLQASVDVNVPINDPISRTFLTRLTFNDPEKLALPGMSGSATLFSNPDNPGGIIIPRDAIVRSSDGSALVWIVVERQEDDAFVKSISIETTTGLGETVEITTGLSGGEEVIVRGNEGLTEGQRVTVARRNTANPSAKESATE